MPYRFYLALTTNPFEDRANTRDMYIKDFGVGATVGLVTIEDTVQGQSRNDSWCALDQDIEYGGSSLRHPMLECHQCTQFLIRASQRGELLPEQFVLFLKLLFS